MVFEVGEGWPNGFDHKSYALASCVTLNSEPESGRTRSVLTVPDVMIQRDLHGQHGTRDDAEVREPEPEGGTIHDWKGHLGSVSETYLTLFSYTLHGPAHPQYRSE